ncbi:entericidin A/B family lipoprotein [Roseovarius autotrophicus]|nr:entericidin A/B family lipoprotein [Roseovarius autotrophicus]MBE0453646.1 entericidin A/B family lipoprotein [Roseovarius sp.]
MKLAMIGLVACMTLAACQTVQGAGRDIETAGKALEKAVQ